MRKSSLADIDFSLFVRLGHDGHCAGGGVNTALRFGGRNTLHTVSAGFKLQAGVYVFTHNTGDDFTIAAVFPFVGADHFYLPAAGFRVPGVHAEQVASKNRSFITTGTGTDFKEHVVGIVRVFGQQQDLQFLTLGFQALGSVTNFFFREFFHLVIAFIQHGPWLLRGLPESGDTHGS